MQIAHVKIKNILGIDELEFSPGGFTQIRGRNGTGKTSVIEAIKATLRGGHDATLLRKGATKGEVVIVLDDGTEVQRKVTESGTTTDVRQGGKKIAKPVDTLKQITDALSVNPVEFLTAKAEDRVRVLLESLPLEADAERLSQIVGHEVTLRQGVHALVAIDEVRKQVYDERTGTNRAVREKSGTIEQLRQAIPPDSTGAEGDEQQLEAKAIEIDDALRAEKERIDTKLATLRKTCDEANQKRRDKIEELRAQIANIQAEIAGEEAAYNDWAGKANKQREKAISKHAADSTPVRAQLQAIRTNREAYARRQQTLDTIATQQVELERLEAEAQSLTEALDAIDAYKLEMLADLPIPGLEIREGALFCDGVAFDRLNTSRQVDIAVELAKVRAGELGVICVDRIESLDPETFEEFRGRTEQSGMQMFVTKVTGDEFTID